MSQGWSQLVSQPICVDNSVDNPDDSCCFNVYSHSHFLRLGLVHWAKYVNDRAWLSTVFLAKISALYTRVHRYRFTAHENGNC